MDSTQVNPFEQAPVVAPQYAARPFEPDAERTKHLQGNIDRASLTDATKELYRTQNAAERIMEFYGLIPFNPKDSKLPYNCNNVAAWDRLRVGSQDIYSHVLNPYNGNIEKHLRIPKDQQRDVLTAYCNAYGLWVTNNAGAMLIKVVPNPPSANKPKESKYNAWWFPKEQFLDPNANNAVIIQPEWDSVSDAKAPEEPRTEGNTDVPAVTDWGQDVHDIGSSKEWWETYSETEGWSVSAQDVTWTSADSNQLAESVQDWQQGQPVVYDPVYQVLVTPEDDLEFIQDQYTKIVTPLTGKALPTNQYGRDPKRLVEKITEAVNQYNAKQLELQQLQTQATDIAAQQ